LAKKNVFPKKYDEIRRLDGSFSLGGTFAGKLQFYANAKSSF
jgi:hypothetical protein